MSSLRILNTTPYCWPPDRSTEETFKQNSYSNNKQKYNTLMKIQDTCLGPVITRIKSAPGRMHPKFVSMLLMMQDTASVFEDHAISRETYIFLPYMHL